MLKGVDASGQLLPGKKYSGRRFDVEEGAGGELVLRPVRLVRDVVALRSGNPAPALLFQIAEVEQVVLPSRVMRNSR